MPTRKRKKIDLGGAVLAEVQQRLALIREKERDLANARDGLNWFLYQQTGVDLGKENWTLDVTHWQLSKES